MTVGSSVPGPHQVLRAHLGYAVARTRLQSAPIGGTSPVISGPSALPP
ncbi:hypothetical protein K7G98_00265 [Saccharothrix sp. MB29]|nr:hypothetical protein [Saccharothrix sp. MB29]